MAKITLLIGLPASGKSTKAKELIKTTGNTVRVNKDLIRTMLHYDKFTGPNERLTEMAERAIATAMLSQGINVVVDDTNLNDKTIAAWALCAQVGEFKLEKIIVDTPLEDCIARDKKRGEEGERFVGKDVIVNMARRYGLYPRTRKDVICDIDGTLCDITQRLNFVKDSDSKNWKAFFADIPNDKPREDVIARVRELSKEFNIVLVSGRPDDYKKETIEWLAKYNVPYETLMMRQGGDRRDDDIVKKEILDKLLEKDQVHMIIDDRPRVLRVWREEFKDYPNVEIWDVGQGIEF